MVEVHSHLFISYFGHKTDHLEAFGGLHRQEGAHFDARVEFAVDLENLFFEMGDTLGITRAESVGAVDVDVEAVALPQPLDGGCQRLDDTGSHSEHDLLGIGRIDLMDKFFDVFGFDYVKIVDKLYIFSGFDFSISCCLVI